MSRPTKIDGLHEPQGLTPETIRDLIRRLIPRMVDDFLAEHQPRKQEVVENKRDNVLEWKRALPTRVAEKPPKKETTPE